VLPLFRAAWKKLGTKRHLWEKIRNYFADFTFPSLTELLLALVQGIVRQPPSCSIRVSRGWRRHPSPLFHQRWPRVASVVRTDHAKSTVRTLPTNCLPGQTVSTTAFGHQRRRRYKKLR